MFNRKPKEKKKKLLADLTFSKCEYCPRDIIKEHEPNKKFFIKDGKRMCMICRATKLSKFGKEITSKETHDRMMTDIKGINEKFDQEENERVISVAAEAQAQVEKKIKT